MKNFDVWSQNTKKLQVFASDNKWIRTQGIKIYNFMSIQISARGGGNKTEQKPAWEYGLNSKFHRNIASWKATVLKLHL